ncbi:unnamed protein product [Gongylonema pulchrum]|uniref:rRNA_proc-arch domain-containing protein n=1 Tax=Gongylonema pulchrum TaxID=637853 RepID=A0A183DDM8_9BILA|nr:unnamed protein product [Gongylonema pulchrum]
MVDQQMGQDVAMKIFKGAPDPLSSQFRLTYNMVLNSLRLDSTKPEFMLENSFAQFQNYDALPQLYQNIDDKKKELAAYKIDDEAELAEYYQTEEQMNKVKKAVRSATTKPEHLLPFLQAGRLLHIVSSDRDFGWAALLNFHKKSNPVDPLGVDVLYVLDVLMLLSSESVKNLLDITQLRPPNSDEKGVLEAVSVAISCVSEISSVRVKLPQNLKTHESKQNVGRAIKVSRYRF